MGDDHDDVVFIVESTVSSTSDSADSLGDNYSSSGLGAGKSNQSSAATLAIPDQISSVNNKYSSHVNSKTDPVEENSFCDRNEFSSRENLDRNEYTHRQKKYLYTRDVYLTIPMIDDCMILYRPKLPYFLMLNLI